MGEIILISHWLLSSNNAIANYIIYYNKSKMTVL